MDSYSHFSFWPYLSKAQVDLLEGGDYLTNEIIAHQKYSFKDYSFLVFPYAKAYEGYLKQLFSDIGFISHLDYISDHLRLGKLLSPNLADRLGSRSLYLKISKAVSKDLADEIWGTWKLARNQIFHYFPHNLKAIGFEEAKELITMILSAMEHAYDKLAP